jgi:hypothetical protein
MPGHADPPADRSGSCDAEIDEQGSPAGWASSTLKALAHHQVGRHGEFGDSGVLDNRARGVARHTDRHRGRVEHGVVMMVAVRVTAGRFRRGQRQTNLDPAAIGLGMVFGGRAAEDGGREQQGDRHDEPRPERAAVPTKHSPRDLHSSQTVAEAGQLIGNSPAHSTKRVHINRPTRGRIHESADSAQQSRDSSAFSGSRNARWRSRNARWRSRNARWRSRIAFCAAQRHHVPAVSVRHASPNVRHAYAGAGHDYARVRHTHGASPQR